MSMPNSPTQFRMHTHRSECAIGLVVTSRKMLNFIAGCHVHSGVHVIHYGTNTDACTPAGGGMYLVVAEQICFLTDHESSPVSI